MPAYFELILPDNAKLTSWDSAKIQNTTFKEFSSKIYYFFGGASRLSATTQASSFAQLNALCVALEFPGEILNILRMRD